MSSSIVRCPFILRIGPSMVSFHQRKSHAFHDRKNRLRREPNPDFPHTNARSCRVNSGVNTVRQKKLFNFKSSWRVEARRVLKFFLIFFSPEKSQKKKFSDRCRSIIVVKIIVVKNQNSRYFYNYWSNDFEIWNSNSYHRSSNHVKIWYRSTKVRRTFRSIEMISGQVTWSSRLHEKREEPMRERDWNMTGSFREWRQKDEVILEVCDGFDRVKSKWIRIFIHYSLAHTYELALFTLESSP